MQAAGNWVFFSNLFLNSGLPQVYTDLSVRQCTSWSTLGNRAFKSSTQDFWNHERTQFPFAQTNLQWKLSLIGLQLCISERSGDKEQVRNSFNAKQIGTLKTIKKDLLSFIWVCYTNSFIIFKGNGTTLFENCWFKELQTSAFVSNLKCYSIKQKQTEL